MARFKAVLGKNIAHFRRVRGLTQKELATRAGTTQKTITLYETGKADNPTAEMIERLAHALDVEESDLVNPGEPPKPVSQPPDLFDAFVMVGEFFQRAKRGDDDEGIKYLVGRILEDYARNRKK